MTQDLHLDQRHRRSRSRESEARVADEIGRSGEGSFTNIARKRVINAPLSSTLKNLHSGHPCMQQCPCSEAIVKHFALGYCFNGRLGGHVAIPLHNMEGQLVGYAGMQVHNSKINDDPSRYVFSSTREHYGKCFSFDNTLLLYHGYAIPRPVDELIVVSSFSSAWRLWARGFQHVVAMMGFTCSRQQAESIVGLTSRSARVYTLLDETQIGQHCTRGQLKPVSRQYYYRLARHR